MCRLTVLHSSSQLIGYIGYMLPCWLATLACASLTDLTPEIVVHVTRSDTHVCGQLGQIQGG